MKKIRKKSAKKVAPVDTSKKIDELLNKATCAVPTRRSDWRVRKSNALRGWRSMRRGIRMSTFRGARSTSGVERITSFSSPYYRAYEERDGDLLKNPAIAEALCIIMNEPRALARKFFYRYTESPQLYGGD